MSSPVNSLTNGIQYAAGTHQLVVDSIGPYAERDEWYLQRIGVHPDYRTRGIATKMIQEQLKKVSPRLSRRLL